VDQLLVLALQIATQLVPPAQEGLILNAQSVTLLLLLWLMEMSAEEFAQQDNIGSLLIIRVSSVLPPVLIALGLELMIATLALMDFI
jgi:hypothetical protein